MRVVPKRYILFQDIGLRVKVVLWPCLDPDSGLPRTVAIRLCLVKIVQTLTNYAQNVRLAKYNKTVQLVFNFIYI
jgi:hypothetical protein